MIYDPKEHQSQLLYYPNSENVTLSLPGFSYLINYQESIGPIAGLEMGPIVSFPFMSLCGGGEGEGERGNRGLEHEGIE